MIKDPRLLELARAVALDTSLPETPSVRALRDYMAGRSSFEDILDEWAVELMADVHRQNHMALHEHAIPLLVQGQLVRSLASALAGALRYGGH